jgi:type I restriction enzyme S subunit
LEHYSKLERHHVRPGDIVFAALGDGRTPAGRSCVVPSDFGPGLVKADCFRVRLPEDRVDRTFLILMLNAPQALESVAGAMKGATRPRVTLKDLRGLAVPLPPLADQRRIAADLSRRLAGAERLTGRIQDELAAIEALPTALLREAFGAPNPTPQHSGRGN